MNIEKLRSERNSAEISKAVVDNKAVLILPDQDIFNYLYTGEIKNAKWEFFNLDPRLYQLFNLIKPEIYNEEWGSRQAIFIHYGGKHKPWQEREKYKLDLGNYYFQYEKELKQTITESSVEINDKAF